MVNKSPQESLDPALLVTRLLEKTQAGKLKWEPTAEADCFIVSVGGNGFRLRLKTERQARPTSVGQFTSINPWAIFDTIETPSLSVVNDKGQTIWTIESADLIGGLWPLFKAAQRVGNRLDERLEEAIAALDRL